MTDVRRCPEGKTKTCMNPQGNGPAMPVSEDSTHPLHIAIRAYALSLSLSLGPALIPFLTPFLPKLLSKGSKRNKVYTCFSDVLRRELGVDGFAFAFMVAVAGGAWIQRILDLQESPRDQELSFVTYKKAYQKPWHNIRVWITSLRPAQKSMLSNSISSCVAASLLRVGSRPSRNFRKPLSTPLTLPISDPQLFDRTSSTLNLTLLLVVRALDAARQSFVFMKSKNTTKSLSKNEKNVKAEILVQKLEKEISRQEIYRRQQHMTSALDALLFWGCSARIMWCFFYEPQRLPKSYVKWIATLADVDPRLLEALRALRAGEWRYSAPSSLQLLKAYSKDLGYPPSWGDPMLLPAFGGDTARIAWQMLNVKGRNGVGGLPCELVHGRIGVQAGLGHSCMLNAAVRFVMAAVEAIAIYLPVHFLPVLLLRPRAVLRGRTAFPSAVAALRSATFLSSFVASFWLAVCMSRTLLLARLLPQVSHNFWDGSYGCVLSGCLTCGSSILIENRKRRSEIALYVLPRAIRTCLPDTWVKSRNKAFRISERLAFVLSLALLLTSATCHPDSLRGLSRWTLSFVINGPNAGFWKRKQSDIPQPPSVPASPSPNVNLIDKPGDR